MLESEVKDFDEEEKKDFLQEYNIIDTGLKLLINEVYSLLNLITFYTAGPQGAGHGALKKVQKLQRLQEKSIQTFRKDLLEQKL